MDNYRTNELYPFKVAIKATYEIKEVITLEGTTLTSATFVSLGEKGLSAYH